VSESIQKPALTYRVTVGNNRELKYEFRESEDGIKLVKPRHQTTETWMALSHNQCDNCPLNPVTHSICPVAENLSVLMYDWQNIISFDETVLEVESKQRTISATTTAQKVLSSLLGLVIATSDCPHTQFFRPMAQFHLPLANSEETTFRAISTHLITQFFRQQNGETVNFDLQGLTDVYNKMHTVNICLKQRIESAVENDAALNAVVLLDIFAITLPNYLDDELEKLKPFFSILLSSPNTLIQPQIL